MENLKKDLKKKLVFNCIMLVVFVVIWITLITFEATDILKTVVFPEQEWPEVQSAAGLFALLEY